MVIRFFIRKLLRKSSKRSHLQLPLANYSDKSATESNGWRSHLCGKLSRKNIGEDVKLCGWVQHNRNGKFIILRDWSGTVQIVPQNSKKACKIPIESVIKYTGTVLARPLENINKLMATGEIEVQEIDTELLNKSKILPFQIIDHANKLEEIRLQYRYLDIRTAAMQNNLRLRSHLIHKMRNFLIDKHNFVEVETPTLFRPTPGGAKEFMVPLTRDPGFYYTLPQSPQQFKQLLMVGGIDRYFQIARCYRDEVSKAERQPEFTQLDLEMSFVNKEDILNLTETLIKFVWPSKLKEKFPVIKYNDAIESYGLDKPDIRFNMLLQNLTKYFAHIPEFSELSIKAIVIPQKITKQLFTNIQSEVVKNVFEDYRCKYGILKMDKNRIKPTGIAKLFDDNLLDNLPHILKATENDTIIFAWGDLKSVNETLGKTRNICFKLINSEKEIIKVSSQKHEFLWVVDFPLFECENGTLNCAHHPFTALHEDDVSLLSSAPEKIRSQSYDLVLNGSEVGGGSIRIHDAELQKLILNDYLKIDHEQFHHLITALESGAPPHGGIALGLDRLFAILCNAKSIRDVIAFPKSTKGKDLMCNYPIKMKKT